MIADIIGLVCLLAYELIKAVKYAAQNKALKKKVYLDEATGLPNKNRCEEILDGEMPECTDGSVALCVFDLNNLRIINNRLGHDQGDAYIRSFAVQLRKALPEEYLSGRDGGDELLLYLSVWIMKKYGKYWEQYVRKLPDIPRNIRRCRSVMR